MLLFDIFLEIDAQHLSSSYQEMMLTKDELDFALKKAVACYRTLHLPHKIDAYQHFLHFCQKAMQGYEKKPLTARYRRIVYICV